jgi:hypothetical protein
MPGMTVCSFSPAARCPGKRVSWGDGAKFAECHVKLAVKTWLAQDQDIDFVSIFLRRALARRLQADHCY